MKSCNGNIPDDILRFALPNKGVLAEPTISILTDAGYKVLRRGKELFLQDKKNQVEFYFLRPRDIATYVGAGYIHAGITGRDLLEDSKVQPKEILELGFGYSKFCLAVPKNVVVDKENLVSFLTGKTIATSYENLTRKFLEEKGISAGIVRLDGAVESSIRLGVADVIADVVDTGRTLDTAGLHIISDQILSSQAIVVATDKSKSIPSLEALIHRLEGILIARQYVLVDYMVHDDFLDKVLMITPGYESATISSLAEPNWKAVRVIVRTAELNQTMDQLKQHQARGIIVTRLVTTRF